MTADTRELRALEVFAEPPPGCFLHLQRDDRHEPHLRAGEFVVIDPTDTEPLASGELYLVQWRSGARQREIMQVVYSPRDHGVWFHPLDRTRSGQDAAARLQAGRAHLSDGPLKPEHLSEYLVGRVIGLFQAREFAPQLAGAGGHQLPAVDPHGSREPMKTRDTDTTPAPAGGDSLGPLRHPTTDDTDLFALWRSYQDGGEEAAHAFARAPAHTAAGAALKVLYARQAFTTAGGWYLPSHVQDAIWTAADAAERLGIGTGDARCSAASPAHTTIIASIGMTFRQAADRVRELLNAHAADEDTGFPDGDGFQEDRRDEWHRLERAIYSTPARTVGDLLVKLERLACPDLGASEKTQDENELAQIRSDLERIAPAVWRAGCLQMTSLIGSIGMTFSDAEARVRELLHTANAAPTDEATAEALSELEHLDAAIAETPPRMPGDAAVILRRLACPLVGAPVGDGDDDWKVVRTVAAFLDGLALATVGAVPHDAADKPAAPAEADGTANSLADTIAAFADEAAAYASPPSSPTMLMVQAGAAAAGISQERFSAAYAAAVQAFQQERAA